MFQGLLVILFQGEQQQGVLRRLRTLLELQEAGDQTSPQLEGADRRRFVPDRLDDLFLRAVHILFEEVVESRQRGLLFFRDRDSGHASQIVRDGVPDFLPGHIPDGLRLRQERLQQPALVVGRRILDQARHRQQFVASEGDQLFVDHRAAADRQKHFSDRQTVINLRVFKLRRLPRPGEPFFGVAREVAHQGVRQRQGGNDRPATLDHGDLPEHGALLLQ